MAQEQPQGVDWETAKGLAANSEWLKDDKATQETLKTGLMSDGTPVKDWGNFIAAAEDRIELARKSAHIPRIPNDKASETYNDHEQDH
jgi:hypothetical protein